MKYIQSFYQYPVTFSSIGKTIPARAATGELRNLAEVTEKELETLESSEPMFRSLVNNKKYRVLNKMPESYKPAAAQINEARAENEELKKRIAELEAANGKATNEENSAVETKAEEGSTTEKPVEEMTYPELQAKAKELGLNATAKKTDLIKMIKEATK